MAVFEDLKKGLGDVDEYLGGKREGYNLTVPADMEGSDIREVPLTTKLPNEFGRTYASTVGKKDSQ